MPDPDRPRRPWYGFRLSHTLELTAVLYVVLIVYAVAYYRRQVALIPAPGRATPRSVLEADDAETEAEMRLGDLPIHFPSHFRTETPR